MELLGHNAIATWIVRHGVGETFHKLDNVGGNRANSVEATAKSDKGGTSLSGKRTKLAFSD